MRCCDRPSPRFSTRTGRLFCGNCRAWLDERETSTLVTPRDESSSRTTNDIPSEQLSLSEAPIVGDGDPTFPGGIGCEYDDSLWATSASWARHMAEAHGEDVGHDLNDEFDQESCPRSPEAQLS